MILLRTHFFDEHISNLAQKLTADGHYNVVILADHRAWEFPTSPYLHVSLSWDRLKALGLPMDIGHDLLWLCGDYGLYVAREEFPHIEYFWLYEYDVVIHADHPAEILLDLDQKSDADLLVTSLRKTDKDYIWSRSLSQDFTELYRCYYPLVRLSRAAIDVMRDARIRLAPRLEVALSSKSEQSAYPSWPNDEVLTATAIMHAGMHCQDILDIFPGLYAENTFHPTGVLVNVDSLLGVPTDGRIYHSVRRNRAYLTAAMTKTSLLSLDSLLRARTTLKAFAGNQWTVEEAEAAIAVIDGESKSRG